MYLSSFPTFIHRVSNTRSFLPRSLTSCIVVVESLSCVWLFAIPWTVACKSSLSMGFLKARILEWVAMPSFRGSSQPRDQTRVSCIAGRFFTVWAIRDAQEYRSGEPIPSPGDLPDTGFKLGSLELQADSLPDEVPGKTQLLLLQCYTVLCMTGQIILFFSFLN